MYISKYICFFFYIYIYIYIYIYTDRYVRILLKPPALFETADITDAAFQLLDTSSSSLLLLSLELRGIKVYEP